MWRSTARSCGASSSIRRVTITHLGHGSRISSSAVPMRIRRPFQPNSGWPELVAGVDHEARSEAAHVVTGGIGQRLAQGAQRRRRHEHDRERVEVGPGRGLELGELGREDGEVGQRLVDVAAEDAAQLLHDVGGVRRATAVVVELIRRLQRPQRDAVVERLGEPIVAVRLGRQQRRPVRAGDLHLAARLGGVAGGELHQLTDLLGPADAAALLVTRRPGAVADDAVLVDLGRADLPADHRLHGVDPDSARPSCRFLLEAVHRVDQGAQIAVAVLGEVERQRGSSSRSCSRSSGSSGPLASIRPLAHR